MMKLPGLILSAAILLLSSSLPAQTVLTIEQVRDRALKQNRIYLQSMENVTKARSEVTTAKSAVLPELTASGRYSRNFRLPSFYVQADTQTIKFTTGFKNEFGAGLSLTQNLFDYKAFQAQNGNAAIPLFVGKFRVRALVLWLSAVLWFR